MNTQTQSLYNILHNIRASKPMWEKTVMEDGEAKLHFVCRPSTGSFNYIMPAEDYGKVSWFDINSVMRYKVNDTVEYLPF